ncbi:TonB-linked SusC/RagA family outer membrane protein [Pedobacter cryoconitis]|uniref:TonB-linked SusC/RagA family outer membrane protein n=1 Tax=Pedobacter cryoconitis TaxID=188932 RepID=A0A7W8ZK64_9SPHI|nr:SusC/RagA family TonB-linked outer membrane protein [Pedobacter cryoconitis]MBB5635564.1 TonB-linked SusC/RagA family outer membrane protein [Pedobacter cryoconitis]MBB6273573.1 TonB-linked SusC/RagA family outer membrane protein [Pedobacter cryoconitis]
MKKLILSLFVFLVIAGVAVAQDRIVTGTVKGKDDNLPIPGVSVKVKGTANGAATGSDGKFSIKAGTGAVLEFSSVGYTRQAVTVGTGSNYTVLLIQDSQSLGEVVVTALGISKAKKTIGYAETTVKSEEINKSASVSLVGGLQGKIAGATISNTSGSPGGSTKVILRGFSSITGSNQPLYVIDGVPLDNSTAGSNDNYDFGNSANDIDPNNIESMSVLKGSAATALYGSRGSSGVILITTKKGKAGSFQVDFSSATTITQVASLYKPQEVFGNGWDATYIPSENGNWGPKLDGVMRSWGAVVDGTQLVKPFSFVKDNVRNALTNGLELNNNLAISGGNESSTFYFAYGNINSNGYLPTDADSYKRNNVTLKGSTKYKNFSIDGSMNYVGKNQRFVSGGGGDSGIGSSFYEEILQIPVDINIKDFRDYKNKFFNVDNYFTPYAENPYYALYENGSRNKSDRVYGNINMNYKVNDWLNIQLQQGGDISNSQVKIWHNKNAPSPGSYNDGGNVEGSKRAPDVGNVMEGSYKTFEYDTKLNLIFNKKLSSKFDLDGLVGANYNDRGFRYLTTTVEDLAIPGFFDISNSSNNPVSTEQESHRRLFGAYAQATLGYDKFLYLTVTGRNDWSSTLAPGKNSYFYPAASLSFLASELFDLSKTPISFLKLRASYGQTGSDTDPFRINNVITRTNIPIGTSNIPGQPVITFPVQGVPGFSVSNTLRNADLKPERVSEGEFGTEIRFFKDRIGLDVTYYNRIRKDQVLAVPIDPASGYTFSYLNFGKVRNRGIEVTLNAKPIVTRDFQWNLMYTFSRDRNLVLELPAGLNKVIINAAYDAQFVAEVGQPMGTFLAPVPVYDPQGRIVVGNNGFPIVAADNGNYGSMQRDFSMGLSNSFTYKNFNLGFTFDWQKGGVFYSGTADLLNFVGADKKTLYNDRRPFIVPNSVKQVIDANGKTTYIENTTRITEGNIDDYYYPTTNRALVYKNRILSKSFLKLREVTLNYTLPKGAANKIGAERINVGVFGRNLITWLPASNQTIDPEVSNYGNDLTSEFGEFRTAPPVRFFGATLKVTF